jgi:hypothetical protein
MRQARALGCEHAVLQSPNLVLPETPLQHQYQPVLAVQTVGAPAQTSLAANMKLPLLDQLLKASAAAGHTRADVVETAQRHGDRLGTPEETLLSVESGPLVKDLVDLDKICPFSEICPRPTKRRRLELAWTAMSDWARGRSVDISSHPCEPWRNGCVESFNSRIRDDAATCTRR